MQEINENRIMPLSAAEKLIKAHDGNMALLYIYLASGGNSDPEYAADALCLTLSELSSAQEKLQRAGLLPLSSNPAPVQARQEKPQPSNELPTYTAEDVKRIAASDEDFKAVLDKAESVFGHLLSSDDMKRLCSIYKFLGLPADVLFVLLQHCADLSMSNSRRLTINFVEKQAYLWTEKELFTVEAAEEYSEHIRELRSSIGKIRARLDIRDRSLTATEENYIQSWLELGFDADTIYEAYDLTVTKTGKRQFPYMNGILQNWHSKGLHTIEAVQSEQKSKIPGQKGSSTSPLKIDTDATKNLLDKV